MKTYILLNKIKTKDIKTRRQKRQKRTKRQKTYILLKDRNILQKKEIYLDINI